MIAIRPLSAIPGKTVIMPGSKSLTQRAMVIAALGRGESLLKNILISEDTLILAGALRRLGAEIAQEGQQMAIRGTAGALVPGAKMELGNNGTALRLLTGVAALAKGDTVLDGGERLRERPLKPLLAALAKLGIESHTGGERGFPPVVVSGGDLQGGEVRLRDIQSSQYVSALLILSPYAAGDVRISLEGRIPSLPYITLTIETMAAFGVNVDCEPGHPAYVVKSGQRYRGRELTIEADASSASYFFLAAALTKGCVKVENVVPETSQGDIGFLSLLGKLGCRVRHDGNGVEVTGAELPKGELNFDLSAMPDIVPTLAVLCAVREGRSVIGNIGHLRLKESDRIAALAAELRRVGIRVEEFPDGLAIDGGHPQGARIKTYNDHRIAMSFAILGLVAPGMEIEDEGCVGKSFPAFWDVLEGLY